MAVGDRVDVSASFQQLAKIDYLDGLGIGIGPREISLVYMAKRFWRVNVSQARTVRLPESGRERLAACEQALREFLSETDISPNQVVLCLPRHMASVSRLTVPEAARASLDNAIGYEVERLFPFPKDELYYDYLTHPVGGDEGRIGVTLFCLRRSEVEDLLSVLSTLALRPHMVTISSCAQMSALLPCLPAAADACVIIGPEGDKLELSFIGDKHLIASHLFSARDTSEAEALDDFLAQAIGRNLPGASVDDTPIVAWGTNGRLPATLHIDHDLGALAGTRFGLPPESDLSPAGLPALGAAVQAVGEVTSGINVLPPVSRAPREKRLSASSLVLASLVLLLGLAWALGVVVQNRRALSALTHQIETFTPEVDQVLADQSEADLLAGRLTVLGTEMDKRLLPLLRRLSDTIPNDMYLTGFQYREGRVELSGVAKTRPASELVAALNRLECLKNVAPKAPFTTTAQGETFTLGAEVVHPCAS